MRRAQGCLVLTLLMLLVLSAGCIPSSESNICKRCLRGIVPDDWRDVVCQEIVTDEECIVFYRTGDSSERSIDAVAYRLIWDRYPHVSNKTPSFVAYDLDMPYGYMCQCECKAERANLLSAYQGDELIIRDKREDEWIRLHAYRWITETKKYQILAYFDGDRIAWETDQVTVDNYTLSGAGLVFRCIYSLRDGASPSNEEMTSAEGELVFPDGLPDDVLTSPYPEVIVLAFYSHVPYADTTAIQGYFADDAWQSVGKCEDEKCGCPTQSSPIAQVRVTNMDIAESRQVISPTTQYCPPDDAIAAATNRAFVTTKAVCEYENGSGEQITVTWPLEWKESGWRLQGTPIQSGE